jgi:hypothetical protein
MTVVVLLLIVAVLLWFMSMSGGPSPGQAHALHEWCREEDERLKRKAAFWQAVANAFKKVGL